MRKACLDEVYKLAKKDKRIVFIGSDLTAGTLDEFKNEMPERFYMEGVSEANIIGLSAGFAMNGDIPYVNTIATFITRRCFEQIVDDIAVHNLNVRLIGNGAGLVYAPLGPTHLAIEDIAIMRSIPNMTILAPCDAQEMKRLISQTVDWQGPIYIRVAKGGDSVVSSPSLPCVIGKAIEIAKGRDALLITTGITLKIALEAREILQSYDIDTAILHMPTIKPLDIPAVLNHARKVRCVITIEEGIVSGGLGSSVSEVLMESGIHKTLTMKRIGIPDVFSDKYGSQKDLLRYYKITPESVVAAVQDCLRRTA